MKSAVFLSILLSLQVNTVTSATTPPTSATIRAPATRPVTTTIPVPTTTPIKGEGPHFHPIYRYSCNEDMSVTFKGVNGQLKFFTPKDWHGPKRNCTITKVSKHYGNFKIPKECLTPSDDIKHDRVVYVSVFDNNEGESKTTLAPNKVTGGYHVFKLTCSPIPDNGVERYALAETGVKDVDVLQNVNNEVDRVDMRFKEAENIQSPDISEIYVGDMFFMYIWYLGEIPYTLLPESCTAHKGTYRNKASATQINLWTNKPNGCLSDDARNYNIMEKFKKDNATMVHAKLHGFRFTKALTNGEDDVTISCVVRICKQSANTECQDQCSKVQGRRRRRRTKTSANFKTVSRTFKVKDKLDSSAAECFKHSSTMLYLVFALVLMKKAF